MPKHLFIKEDLNIKQKAFKLYKQGLTMREVGKKLKKSRQWVCNIVRQRLGKKSPARVEINKIKKL